MAIRTECKSRFPNGTILTCFSPDFPSSIGGLHAMLGVSVVNGFAHGASSVVVELDPEACIWTVDCTAYVEPSATFAGFDATVPLDIFLKLRAGVGIVRHSMRESVVLRDRHRRKPRWQLMYDLDEICGETTDDEPFTLGGFAEICADTISRAIGSGGRTIRFELFPKAMKLVVGDDGETDNPIRSDDALLASFRKLGVESVYAHYGRIQPHANA